MKAIIIALISFPCLLWAATPRDGQAVFFDVPNLGDNIAVFDFPVLCLGMGCDNFNQNTRQSQRTVESDYCGAVEEIFRNLDRKENITAEVDEELPEYLADRINLTDFFVIRDGENPNNAFVYVPETSDLRFGGAILYFPIAQTTGQEVIAPLVIPTQREDDSFSSAVTITGKNGSSVVVTNWLNAWLDITTLTSSSLDPVSSRDDLACENDFTVEKVFKDPR